LTKKLRQLLQPATKRIAIITHLLCTFGKFNKLFLLDGDLLQFPCPMRMGLRNYQKIKKKKEKMLDRDPYSYREPMAD
jgi:hypothetical protein